MFYLMPLMVRMMGRTLRPNTQRFITKTVMVIAPSQLSDSPIPEKSVEQLEEEKQHAKDVQARKLADALNTDYFD